MPVRWTKLAVDDFTHICDYTAEHFGPAQGRRTALAIYDSLEALGPFPYKGRPGRKPDTRELDIPKSPFVAIYRVREGVIEIARILHSGQKWP